MKDIFQSSKKRGFTLIELLVVISIIGVLATLIINNLNSARSRARDAKRKQGFSQLKTALQMYYNDYQSYPLVSGVSLMGCGDNGDEACEQLGVFSAGSEPTVYMKSLPEITNYTSDGDTYLAKVILENTSDPDILTSQASCPGGNYDTVNVVEYAICTD